MPSLFPAPELDVIAWLNTPEPIRLAGLRGKVVVIEAFQMLCPGCAQVGLPQLARIHEQFPSDDVVVLGLHTVFEHHEVQGPRAALEAFLHEYRYGFPVGIDRPISEGGPIPSTMRAYSMEGTPTLILIDRQGRLRRQTLGHVPDLRLGAEIMALMMEAPPAEAGAIGPAVDP
jgi:thiol-disulfide isomerase/thioredoxin